MGSNPNIEVVMHEAAFDVQENDALAAQAVKPTPALAHLAARQATQQPRHTTVVDAHGRQLRVGDRVTIEATVEALNPEGYGNNIILRTVREMPPAYSYGPHKSPIHLNGGQCVRVQPGGV